MPALTYYVATSLDGFIADPGGDFSAFPYGDHIAGLAERYPETFPVHARAALGIEGTGTTFDTVLMGWNTFAVGLAEGIDSPYPHLRQLVFSHRDRRAEVGAGVELVSEDPASAVDRLRAQPSERDIWLCGGGQLAGQLAEVIDRVLLKVNPIAFGDGIALFGPGAPPLSMFELAASPVTYESGVVVLDYRR